MKQGMQGTQQRARLRDVVGQSGVLIPEDAGRTGLSGEDLREACRSGDLVRVRFGTYASAETWRALDESGRYRLRVLAAARRLRAPLFSHDSAAALWRLPRLDAWPADVHVTVPHDLGGRSGPGVRRHAVTSVPRHVVSVDGVRTTGVARTVVDVARSWTFASAVVAADHALARGWATADRLAGELAATGPGRGTRRAHRVLDVASGASESVGESLSRARIVELGLPAPELQHEVRDEAGVVGRVDFWWEHLGLVGEFDGRMKYRVDGVVDHRALEDRVWEEKRREDRLRAAGLRVVRWTWDVAIDPDRLAGVLAGAGLRP